MSSDNTTPPPTVIVGSPEVIGVFIMLAAVAALVASVVVVFAPTDSFINRQLLNLATEAGIGSFLLGLALTALYDVLHHVTIVDPFEGTVKHWRSLVLLRFSTRTERSIDDVERVVKRTKVFESTRRVGNRRRPTKTYRSEFELEFADGEKAFVGGFGYENRVRAIDQYLSEVMPTHVSSEGEFWTTGDRATMEEWVPRQRSLYYARMVPWVVVVLTLLLLSAYAVFSLGGALFGTDPLREPCEALIDCCEDTAPDAKVAECKKTVSGLSEKECWLRWKSANEAGKCS